MLNRLLNVVDHVLNDIVDEMCGIEFIHLE